MIFAEDIDLGQIRIDMKREGEDITTEETYENDKDHTIERSYDRDHHL